MGEHLLVQLSDVHLTSAGRLSSGAVPREALRSALTLLEEREIRPDVLLCTGDLTDAGEPACYEDLAELVAAAAARLGASVVYLPGNHDDRAAFRRHLLGEISPSGRPGAGEGPINQVHWQAGLRIVALDSTVPGEDRGELAEETLAFLRRELESPAPDGTVVALHHPPVPSPIPAMSAIRLAAPELLAEALEGSDACLVVCGHDHHPALGTLGQLPVWVGPACAYRADVTSLDRFRGVPGSALSRIDLGSHGVLATVVPVLGG